MDILQLLISNCMSIIMLMAGFLIIVLVLIHAIGKVINIHKHGYPPPKQNKWFGGMP